jgi:hypothetical protein
VLSRLQPWEWAMIAISAVVLSVAILYGTGVL